MNFSDYGKSLGIGGVRTNGQRHSYEAQDIIESTWYDDPASTIIYLYSYEYDDDPNKNKGMNPEYSKTKIPVDAKYSIASYRSLSKDEVDSRIMFKPSYKCNIPYYDKKIGNVTDAIFPSGLYCDVQDKDKIWHKWLVINTADSSNNDFPTWSILPCGHKFQWVYKGQKMEMWGVERSQSS